MDFKDWVEEYLNFGQDFGQIIAFANMNFGPLNIHRAGPLQFPKKPLLQRPRNGFEMN